MFEGCLVIVRKVSGRLLEGVCNGSGRCQVRASQDSSSKMRSSQDRSSKGTSSQDMKTLYVRNGQVRTG